MGDGDFEDVNGLNSQNALNLDSLRAERLISGGIGSSIDE